MQKRTEWDWREQSCWPGMLEEQVLLRPRVRSQAQSSAPAEACEGMWMPGGTGPGFVPLGEKGCQVIQQQSQEEI